MAFKILGLAFRNTWQELWTILVIQLLFLLAVILVIPAPPAILALFHYGNRVAHDESANERDFLRSIHQYWRPAWRWGLMNILIIGLLTGDYYLVENLTNHTMSMSFVQGLYLTLLASWLLLQLFTLPFLFEQTEPQVLQALRNAAVFLKRNLILAIVLGLLLALSLMAGALLFMLTFAFGGAFLAFAGNHAVLRDLAEA
ncbi:MAG TPA: hypothetical protein VJ830_11230 [Anaerolineales bacterium]|nr:hypothetical protein [Anaerolineales bacterium]